MKKPSQRSGRGLHVLSPPKKFVFFLATLFLVLAVLETSTRVIELVQRSRAVKTNPYVDPSNPVPVFELSHVGAKVHQRTEHHPLVTTPQQFSAVKSEDTFRVFMLGGSAAAGWPHREYSITSLLERKLRTVFPEKTIEVLNAAGGTYASHRVRFVFDEVVEYQPDLILIYSGNNEFLENFVFPSQPRLSSPWRHSALVRVLYLGLSQAWAGAPPKPTFDVQNYNLADQRSNRLSYAFGKASKYRQDPKQFRTICEHYRYNIESMVDECIRRNIPVVVFNVPVNLKDWIPNVSVHRGDITSAELEQWQTHFREGYLALERESYEAAAASLERAAGMDDEHAETHYRLGLAKLHLGLIEDARHEFVKALVRDAYPFRALPEFQAIISDIADTKDVPLIDVVSLLEAQAEDQIIGLDVLLDYVHLTARSQEAVAQEVVKHILKTELLPMPTNLRLEDIRINVPRDLEDTLTDESDLFLAQAKLFGQFLVMRQYHRLEPLRAQMMKVLTMIAKEQPELAQSSRLAAKNLSTTMEVIEPYRELLEAEKLGILEEKYTRAEANRIYAFYAELTRQSEAADMSLEEFKKLVPKLRYKMRKNKRQESH